MLSENTWKKTASVSKLKPVTQKLNTATGNELTVSGETAVGFRIGNMDCSWPVMIALGLAYDCILG